MLRPRLLRAGPGTVLHWLCDFGHVTITLVMFPEVVKLEMFFICFDFLGACVCAYLCVYMCPHVCVHVYRRIHVYVFMCACVYKHVGMCMCV